MSKYFRDQQAVFFKDRIDGGQKLAGFLDYYKDRDVVIYALPRGGVVVAAEIAKALHAPFDLIITRKISHPDQPEYAVGAVAENGHVIFNKEAISDINEIYLTSEVEAQKREAQRRRKLYLSGRKPVSCKGKIAVLVDDGIATGLTIKAAIKELRLHYKPKQIIVAVPVIPRDFADGLEAEGIKVVAVITTRDFLGSIGAYYENFPQVTDEEVIRLMNLI